MPYRNEPIITEEIYHVFNRSIGGEHIFKNYYNYLRILDTINFYRFSNPVLRFSHYNRMTIKNKNEFLDVLYENQPKMIKILGFCIMPNHFHFLIKQLTENGISTFMRRVENSYAKFYNTKFERKGALFQSMFKLVLIENENQLIHTLRYIHLNPITSYILKSEKELFNYKWSSIRDYLGKKHTEFVDVELISKMFSGIEKIKEFTLDQVNYQRELYRLKHLALD